MYQLVSKPSFDLGTCGFIGSPPPYFGPSVSNVAASQRPDDYVVHGGFLNFQRKSVVYS
jgi:hypothetical protein